LLANPIHQGVINVRKIGKIFFDASGLGNPDAETLREFEGCYELLFLKHQKTGEAIEDGV
jgi:hypothetical protein